MVTVWFGLPVIHKISFHCLFLDFFREMTLFLEYKLLKFVFRIVIAFQCSGGL